MIDLHLHSNCSDGTLSPFDLIKRAEELNIKAVALTDHDTASGVRSLKNHKFRVKFVPGIEISVQYDKNLRFHILGLFIDPNSKAVFEFEKLQVDLRQERNLQMLEKLKKLNYDITFEEVKKEAKVTIGRMHFATCLVKKRYFKRPMEAIEALLKKGKPAFVERKRLGAEEGILRIRKMKGISVVAHIGKEIDNLKEIEDVLKNLKGMGLDGVEVFHSDHSNEMAKNLKKISKKLSLVQSGGSDFHGENKKSVEIGTGRGNLNVPFKVYNNLKEYWEKII